MECIWDAALLRHSAQLAPGFAEVIEHGSHKEYLDSITKASLDPRYTYVLFAHCENVFSHVCAELKLHGEFETVIATVARILPFAPYLHPYAERLLDEKHDFAKFDSDEAGALYLLGLFRLLSFDRRMFAKKLDAGDFVPLLRHQFKPIVYLAICILQICLSAADHWFERMVDQYVGPASPEGAIEGIWDDKVIDYRFLPLWEDERLDKLKILLYRAEQEVSQDMGTPCRTIPVDVFDQSVTLVGATLLPRALPIKVGYASTHDVFVDTRSSVRNLNILATKLKQNKPLLITGPAGSGKTTMIRHAAQRLGKLDQMITLHLNEQSDAKLLTGIYSSGETPGSFVWRPGVLTTAVQEGRWVLIEDLDRAPRDIVASLLPLIERRELHISSRKETICAAPGFRIIATLRSTTNLRGEQTDPSINILGVRLWEQMRLDMLSAEDVTDFVAHLYPMLSKLLPQLVAVYQRLQVSSQSTARISRDATSTFRPISVREMLKWCGRIVSLIQNKQTISSQDFDDVFVEAVDSFLGCLPDTVFRRSLEANVAEELRIDPQRRDYLLSERDPQYSVDKTTVKIGHYVLARKNTTLKKAHQVFSTDPHATRMLERLSAAVNNREPMLLVGETGVGKTSTVQHLAAQLGKSLLAINMSQQSEAGDLLGGFKPVSIRNTIMAMKDEFDVIFTNAFSMSKNQPFLDLLNKQMAKGNWKAICKLWRQALDMVEQRRAKSTSASVGSNKKRKIDNDSDNWNRWDEFSHRVHDLEKRLKSGSEAFAFDFIEGNLVKAVRHGDWVLLDEINLAESDTLEAIVDLLDSRPSILLTEAGKAERVEAHPEFRMFAAMNPATDVGKKDLAPGIRSRFTELYVRSPDQDLKSLQSIVQSYLHHDVSTDKTLPLDVSVLYQKLIGLAKDNKLVDGAGQRPHFSLRTLTRTLSYARYIAPLCNLRRALYEGFQMSFLTFLDKESTDLVLPLLKTSLFSKTINIGAELQKALRKPLDGHQYVQGFPGTKHWVRQGPSAVQQQTHYILTPFIRNNMENLIRATSTRRFPVLVEGPTSSGKTSMIEYLAKRTGHNFVRINNHEHTDIQEYLGTYVSTSDGRLEFQEGILVQALREGHWIVLDELNLAPTDVLEALNRLLDDNRELLIPETQQVVHPHENFMLFATQNPAGLYGGRKPLSRAFRNRFLELHFDDIPTNELQEILHRRTGLPESRARRIVSTYKELAILRAENRLFERKGFATLRDLFRWAQRPNDTIEQLASNGFMLLAERVRKLEERNILKEIIQKAMSTSGPRVQINDSMYSTECVEINRFSSQATNENVIWTKAMRRLFILVLRAIENNEPVLLIGETGCGKTTVCQMVADFFSTKLHTVNAHQNTETSDLVGSQRPVRNRGLIESSLRAHLLGSPIIAEFESSEVEPVKTTDELLIQYDTSVTVLDSSERQQYLNSEPHQTIQAARARYKALFEWRDGSLVQAMKDGCFFLLDEISLADDSVLERINSVLEPDRSILLAEKGSLDSFVSASSGFQFFATMNPGGDYGKRELSPALRNRFTEIWVPPLSDADDIIQIVTAKLHQPAKVYANAIVEFALWFKNRFNTSSSSSFSIRDALAWIDFVNTSTQADLVSCIVHGAAMVYIDTLGANPAGLMAPTTGDVTQERRECLHKLALLLKTDAASIYSSSVEIQFLDEKLSIGPFSIPRQIGAKLQDAEFSFDAPTTRLNAMRVVRALQLPKPIMLEGNPGVGKTALVTAIAKAAGMSLTRINLSEQTDLLDLFGADAPIDGELAGTFAWRDAPFLRAMKEGEWVLLDEMNLASQSVLEGLNSCLDHRGDVFVPELGQNFKRHPDFRLFAAQNPHHQGGGRKGLPASFVNRFTLVYADAFQTEDLMIICLGRFRNVDELIIRQAVTLVEALERSVSRNPRIGMSGRPWEFNLRDVSRWLSLMSTNHGFLKAGTPLDFFDLLFSQRFRSASDKAFLSGVFGSIFKDTPGASDLFPSVSTSTLQIGLGLLPRSLDAAMPSSCGWRPKSSDQLRIIQSVIISLQQRWPVILTGSSGAGKTALIQRLADISGASVETLTMSADTDVMDLIGGYEESDHHRQLSAAQKDLQNLMNSHVRSRLVERDTSISIQKMVDCDIDILKLKSLGVLVDQLPATASNQIHIMLRLLQQQDMRSKRAQFEWVDGPLVEALESGKWLVLDNANLANSSVLDRLNGLLEPDGVLVVNEQNDESGLPRIIQPHPDFRIFLTLNPRYGELSRAMRNRGVEFNITAEVHPSEEPFSCYDPLMANSAMARFYQAKGLQSIPHELLERVLNILHDHLSIADQLILQRFQRQIKIGLYSGLEFLGSSSPPPWQLLDSDRAISTFYRDLIAQNQLPPEVSRVQTLNPLNNQSLILCSHDASSRADALCFTFDKVMTLASFNQRLSLIEQDSDQVQSLRRSERTLDYISPRRESKLVSVSRTILDSLLSIVQRLTSRTFSDFGNLKESTSKLCTFWALFADRVMAMTFDAAVLRSLSALGLNLVREIGTIGHMDYGNDLQKIDTALSSLDHSIPTTRGSACVTLWTAVKPSVPITADRFHALIKCESMADSFDEACQSFELPLSDMIDLRQSFARCLHLGSTGEADVAQLSAQLDALAPFYRNSSIVREPHFLGVIRSLYEHFLILELGAPVLSTTERTSLGILAGWKTKQAEHQLLKKPYSFAEYLQLISAFMIRLINPSTRETNITYFGESFLHDMKRVDSVSLRNLEFLRVETEFLSKVLAGHSDALGKAELYSLDLALYCMCDELFDLLSRSNNLGHQQIIQELLGDRERVQGSAVDENQDEPNVIPIPARIHSQVITWLRKVASYRTVADVDEPTRLMRAAEAWASFGLACLTLYVPDAPFDPALQPQLEKQMHSYRQEDMRSKHFAIQLLRSRITGNMATIRTTALEKELAALGPGPSYDDVYRPERSQLALVQADLDSLMLLLTQSSSQTVPLSPTLLENITRLRCKLQDERREYRDYVAPVIGFIDSLLVGHTLATRAMHELQKGRSEGTLYSILPFVGGSIDMWLSDDSLAEVVKSAVPILERCCWLKAIACRSVTQPLYVSSENLRYKVEEQFLLFYQQWRTELTDDQRKSAAKSSLYKFKGSDEDTELTEADLDELFPTFDHESEPDIQRPTSLRLLHFTPVIAQAHSDIYERKDVQNDSLDGLFTQWSAALTEHPGLCSTDEVFPIMFINLQMLQSRYSTSQKPSSSYNIYTDANVPEAMRLTSSIKTTVSRFSALQTSWPDHATPMDVLRVCEQLLNISHCAPLTQFIPLLERLHSTVNDWQKIASREFSASNVLDDITGLIVHWRQLELSSWTGLFDREWQNCERDALSWWFIAYESVVASSKGISDPKDMAIHTQNLLKTLTEFLFGSGLGEYTARIQMLRGFEGHLSILAYEMPLLEVVRCGLSNFVAYFETFESMVSAQLTQGRSDLDKEVQNVIQLASWKDRNIDVLRQSARASHRKLLRLVRKYRLLLSRPASSLLSGGFPAHLEVEAPSNGFTSLLSKPVDSDVSKVMEISRWSNRPQRFRTVQNTAETITAKASQLPHILDGPSQLARFSESILNSINELRKATPNILDENNKSLVKHLKNRKRRLLAEVLKNVRSMGFQPSNSEQVLVQQSCLEFVLAGTPPLSKKSHSVKVRAAENEFFKLVSIMPAVRAASRKHSEDLTAAEIGRCISLQESMLQEACCQRKNLACRLEAYHGLIDIFQQFENFGRSTEPTPSFDRGSDTSKIWQCLAALAPVLSFAFRLVQVQSSLADRDYQDVERYLEKEMAKLTELQNRRKQLLRLPLLIQDATAIELGQELVVFCQNLLNGTETMCLKHPELSPVLSHIPKWVRSPGDIITDQLSMRDTHTTGLDLWLQQAFNVFDTVLGTVQDSAGIADKDSPNKSEKYWLLNQEKISQSYMEAMRLGLVAWKFKELLEQLHNMIGADVVNAAAVCQALLPIFSAYLSSVEKLVNISCDQHLSMNKTAYMLAENFVQLAQHGFCTPSEKSEAKDDQSGNVESGTGLGNGEGAEDISKDIEDDEDLSELAQQPKEEGESEGPLEDSKDAVDMADEDLEGDLDNGMAESERSDGNQSDALDDDGDMEEEVGKVDDSGPSAIDEKIWDGDQNQQDGKEAQDTKGSVNKDEVGAMGGQSEEDTKMDDEQNGDLAQTPPPDEMENVEHEMADQLDPMAPTEGNLELPDEIDFGEKERKDQESSDVDSIPDEIMDEGDIAEDDTAELTKESDSSLLHPDDDHSSIGEPDLQRDAGDGAESGDESDKISDTLMQDNEMPYPEVEDTGMAEAGNGADQAETWGEGVQKRENEEEQLDGEDSNLQGQGGAQEGQTRAFDDKAQNTGPEESKESQESAYKQLGNVLNEWYNQHRKIETATDQQEPQPPLEQGIDMNSASFQHLGEDGGGDADTQALGAATMEESTALNEDQAKAVNDDDIEQPFIDTPAGDGLGDKDIPDLDQAPLDLTGEALSEQQPRTFVGPSNTKYIDDEMANDEILADAEKFEDVDRQLTNTHISMDEGGDEISDEEARQQWSQHEENTRTLSLILTEHLRLILQPTQATKMRGDYRTGKRLNIKRIIPYIASSFKRDKIWMRRSIPSKRAYQVMLSIDDSKSMSESGSRELAFETLALIAKGMSMLDIGELSIVGFGENVVVAHDFSTSFGPETGANVLKHFSFAQSKTNVRKLLTESMDMFRAARLRASSSSSDLWQLQLIISDGICEDHPAIRQLVRQAHEERIMIVFVVIDAATQHAQSSSEVSQSILDLQTAEFMKNSAGEMQLSMVRYLDTFPFRYYLIVRDVKELPGVLAGALRQWFEEVAGASS